MCSSISYSDVVGEISVGHNTYLPSTAVSLRDSKDERLHPNQRKTCKAWHGALANDRSYARISVRRQNSEGFDKLDSGQDTGRDVEKLYKRFEPLLKKTARSFYRIHRSKITSYEDLYQTICYLFLYALKNYDSEKGNLAPHIKRTIDFKLRSMLRGEKAPLSGTYPFSFLSKKVYSLDAHESYL